MSAPPRSAIPRLVDLPLELTTARLRLRPYLEADVDAMWPYVSDPAFPVQMSWAAHRSKAETLAFVQAARRGIPDNTSVTWAILLDGGFIGAIALGGIRWQVSAWRVDRAEVGYWLAPAHWNRGFATEATVRVMSFGFDTLGLHKIVTSCLVANAASRRVIEKCGFRWVGQSDEDVWRDGAWHAHQRYELVAREWAAHLK